MLRSMEISSLSPKETEALEFALTAHQDQTDKQGKPYILHVLRVAFSVFEHSTENVLIAALLHDVVEDCEIDLGEIATRFGERVAQAVDHLSRRRGESYSAYILRLKTDNVARRVKLADLADNLDEARMGQIDVKDQKRLRKRYVKAVEVLGS